LKVIIAIVLASIIIQLLISPQTIAAINNTQSLKEKATYLTSTFNTANHSISQTIRNLNAKTIPIPQESINSFKDAQTLAEQSKNQYAKGNFLEVINLLMQAFQKLKQTLTTIYGSINEPSTQQQIRQEQIINMQNAIIRDFEILKRIESIANIASSRGINVTIISQKTLTIKTYLNSAKNNLDEDKLLQAKTKIAQADSLINDLTSYFNSFAATLKTERVASYISISEQNLETLKQQLSSVSNQLSQSNQLASSSAITQAQTSLTRAKEYLSNQQINQTINELTTVKTLEATITNYINSTSRTATPTPSITPSSKDTSNTSASVTSVKP
jgi:hypothetical protein